MSDDRVKIRGGQVDVDLGLGAVVEVVGLAGDWREASQRVASLLRAGLAAEQAPEGRLTTKRHSWGNEVSGRCPACGNRSMFVAVGGHVTCSIADCTDPCAAADLLEQAPAPPGLSVGPIVDGRQTYYGPAADVPPAWNGTAVDGDSPIAEWPSLDLFGDSLIVQCRAPLPAPATEKVRLDQVIDRTVVGADQPVCDISFLDDGQWLWAPACAGWEGFSHLPIDDDGLIEVLALTEDGAS